MASLWAEGGEGVGGAPSGAAETNSPWSGQLVASLWAEGVRGGGGVCSTFRGS